ncbi:MAG: hypothetical protein ABS980_23215, partial [Rhodococcus sp. (in: high G+C Gram-positive bacteria)]
FSYEFARYEQAPAEIQQNDAVINAYLGRAA